MYIIKLKTLSIFYFKVKRQIKIEKEDDFPYFGAISNQMFGYRFIAVKIAEPGATCKAEAIAMLAKDNADVQQIQRQKSG